MKEHLKDIILFLYTFNLKRFSHKAAEDSDQVIIELLTFSLRAVSHIKYVKTITSEY